MHEVVLGQKPARRPRPDGTIAEPLAALDVTFSPSKSVSLLWALTSDPKVQAAVLDAHEDAVVEALGWLDAHAGHTRAGRNGVRKVAGEGFVIAQFRHRTARSTDPSRRAGDPQLHSHCAILNRVQGADGKWRTLDSKAIYRHAHHRAELDVRDLDVETVDGRSGRGAPPEDPAGDRSPRRPSPLSAEHRNRKTATRNLTRCSHRGQPFTRRRGLLSARQAARSSA